MPLVEHAESIVIHNFYVNPTTKKGDDETENEKTVKSVMSNSDTGTDDATTHKKNPKKTTKVFTADPSVCNHKSINRRAPGTNHHAAQHQCLECGKKWLVKPGQGAIYD